jgi:hypothetical protein
MPRPPYGLSGTLGLITVMSLLFLASCTARPMTRTVTLAQSWALEGNPSTGFDWAPGTVTYRFRAAAQGSTDLVINYSRSFESVPPERTFKLTVRVGPS